VAVGALSDPRVAEEAADRVLAVEGLERPAVGIGPTGARSGGGQERCEQHGAAQAPRVGSKR
jgi:hypothetical protein